MAYVFDTSVLIAVIKEEFGFEEALEYLQNQVWMSSINLAEFFAWAMLHSDSKEKELLEFIKDLKIQVVDFDLKTALDSAKIITKTKQYGLSLGDRACLMLGKNLNLPVITCDKVWDKVKMGCEVVVLR